MGESSVLAADAVAVLARWNPDGAAAIADSGAGVSVSVVGSRAVERELSRHLRCVPSPLAAAVVVVALDSAVPLGRDVLEVLEVLAADGHSVVFALDGRDTDRNFDTALGRVRSLLRERTPGFGAHAVLPVSTRAAERERAGDPVGPSGVEALVAAAEAAAAVRAADDRVVAATRSAGELALRRIGAQADVVRSATDVTALRAERMRIVARRDSGKAEAVAALRGQIQLARVELVGDVGSRVRALHNAVRAELERAGSGALGECPGRLTDAVVDLTTAVDGLVVDRCQRIAATAVGTPLRTVPAPPAIELGDAPQPRARTVEDRMMVVLGASAGVGLGRLAVAPLSLVPALDIATIPVTLLLGGVASWWLTRSRGRVADRVHLRQWLGDVLVNVKAQLEQWVSAAIVATESELTERIVRAAAAHTAAVDAEITRLETELRGAGARTAGQLAACERDREVLARGIAALTARTGTEPGSGASNETEELSGVKHERSG